MNTGETKIVLVLLVCLASLCCLSPAYASLPEKEATLQSCARLFGPTIDERRNLFEVNQAFILQAKFNKQGQLEEFAVEPKYFFNETHPEWKEPSSFPSLSQSEFRDLVVKLENVKPKGKMIKPRNDISTVNNSTAYYQEMYKHAVLKWGELADWSGVRFFRIRYLKAKS
jgi:hypothetical protein